MCDTGSGGGGGGGGGALGGRVGKVGGPGGEMATLARRVGVGTVGSAGGSTGSDALLLPPARGAKVAAVDSEGGVGAEPAGEPEPRMRWGGCAARAEVAESMSRELSSGEAAQG